jgi:hypothetical protein
MAPIAMDRLIFTVARGKPKYREMALGLGRSLRLVGDGTPTAILTDIDADWHRYFDIVIPAEGASLYFDDMRALDLTGANHVLALDCDTLVFRPLAPIFDYCAGSHFAVQGHHESSGTWHGGDIADICKRNGVPSIPRFNGGMLYYERTPEGLRLMNQIRLIEANYAESGFKPYRGLPCDEPCIGLAMAQTGIGKVIPDELDFMSTAVGLVGRLRMDVSAGECGFLCRRERLRYIRPYILHASRYSNFLIYWRELKRLRSLWSVGTASAK